MANPFAYEEYRQKSIREKLDADRAARISVNAFLQFYFFSHLGIS
jgi:hypothetical protein